MTLGGVRSWINGLDGGLDGLLFSSRVWSEADITEYYNSGSGQYPPFTE